MKLKKTLALLMTAALGVGTLAGCSEATTNYTKELSKAAEWKSTSTEAKGNVSVEAQGQKINISFNGTGYTSGSKAYTEVKFNDPSGVFKIPEIKMYADNGVAYINKSYFEGIYTMSGQKVPEKLSKINAEYIGIDFGMDVASIQKITADPEAVLKFGKTLFGDADIDLPYVQNGREFTMNLNSDELVDLIVKAAKASSNNLEKINTELKLGLSTEQINKVKAAVNNKDLNTAVQQIKTMIAGSNISEKDVFSDNTYTQDINMAIQLKNLGKLNITANSKSTKAAAKEITIPASSIKLTQKEYIELMAEPASTTQTSSLPENVKFVPAA